MENKSNENKEMLGSQNEEIKHHVEELKNALKVSNNIPAWVVAKMERSATDISDVTHYLDAENKMATGGGIGSFSEGDDVTYRRSFTGVKFKGKVIEIDSDGKYLKVRNTIGGIDYLPVYEVKKYGIGGNLGGTSDSAEMDAPTIGGTMESSLEQYKNGGKMTKNKLEIVNTKNDKGSLNRILDAINLVNKNGCDLQIIDKSGHYSGNYGNINSVYVYSNKSFAEVVRKFNAILNNNNINEIHINTTTEMKTGGGLGKTYEVEYIISGKKYKSTYLLYEGDRIEKMLPVTAVIINIKETKKMATGGGVVKNIIVEVNGGKKINYTNSEIQEMIDEIDMYMSSDNLPKWIIQSRKNGNINFPKDKKGVLEILKEIVNSKNDVYINVDSTIPPYKNYIKMAKGGGVSFKYNEQEEKELKELAKQLSKKTYDVFVKDFNTGSLRIKDYSAKSIFDTLEAEGQYDKLSINELKNQFTWPKYLEFMDLKEPKMKTGGVVSFKQNKKEKGEELKGWKHKRK